MDERKILRLIEKEGAITTKSLRDELQISEEEACHIISSLLVRKKLVWVPSLPRQGVFFTLSANKGQYGLVLRRRAGGVKGSHKGKTPSKPSKRVRSIRTRILMELDTSPDQTIDELSEHIETKRDSTRRHLSILESKGLVVSRPLITGERGRPARLWSLASGVEIRDTDDLDTDEVVIDFSSVGYKDAEPESGGSPRKKKSKKGRSQRSDETHA